jgi:hypothetical protein
VAEISAAVIRLRRRLLTMSTVSAILTWDCAASHLLPAPLSPGAIKNSKSNKLKVQKQENLKVDEPDDS